MNVLAPWESIYSFHMLTFENLLLARCRAGDLRVRLDAVESFSGFLRAGVLGSRLI